MLEDAANGATPIALNSQEIYLNPHPVFHRLRAQDPVHWSTQLQSWLLLRYDDVSAALRDERLAHNGAQTRISRLPQEVQDALQPLKRSIDHWMGLPTAEDHERYRQLLSHHFTPRSVNAMRPRIEARFDAVVDAARAAGRPHVDVVHEVAYPFGAGVIADLIGLQSTPIADLLRWSHDLVEVFQVSSPAILERAQTSLFALEDSIRAAIAAHRAQGPGEGDLIHAFLAGQREGTIHGDEEIIANCVALMFVGFETTSNLVAGGLSLLLERPSELEKLRASPELLQTAIDEMLRYDGPAFFISRVARQDFELRGQQIRARDLVLLGLGVANRDPAVFPDPDHFDISRKPNRHLAFAVGPYSCLGAALARVETTAAFSKLLELPLRPSALPPRWKEFRPFGRRLLELPVCM